MAKRENKAKTAEKHDVLIYYVAYLDGLEIEEGRPLGIYFRSKKALFEACSQWLDQGIGVTICEEGMEFSDRQPPRGA